MQSFDIPGMRCGHCVPTITQALLALDPVAAIQADHSIRRLRIDSAVDAAQLSAAIAAAGYANTARDRGE